MAFGHSPESNDADFYRREPLAYNFMAFEWVFFVLRKIGHFAGTPFSKFGFNHGYDRVGIEIAGHDEGHIISYKISVVIFLHPAERRIFEMLGLSDGAVGAVRMLAVKALLKVF